jgi:hypothetical protein
MLPVKRSKKLGPTKLTPILDNRLLAYVAGASAAGVTTLALGQSAAAEIVYTPADIDVGAYYAIDLNHDGIADFTLETVPFDSGHGHFLILALDVPGNAGQSHAGPLPIASAIEPRRQFTTSTYYGGLWMGAAFEYGTQKGSWGPWFNVTNKFIGLKFMIDGEVHYGWARVTVSGGISAILTGYAYETIPNRGLRAGQRSESEDETSSVSPLDLPTLSSLPNLGSLASGANGQAIWRREDGNSARHD